MQAYGDVAAICEEAGRTVKCGTYSYDGHVSDDDPFDGFCNRLIHEVR